MRAFRLLFCVALSFCLSLTAPARAQDAYRDAINEFSLAPPSSTDVLQDVAVAERRIARGNLSPALRAENLRRFQVFAPIGPSELGLGVRPAARPSASGIRPSGLGLDLGSDARPYVVKYACCTETELFQGPRFDAPILGTAAAGSEVWVFDLFGAGLPNGLASCAGVPAPCPHLWAEVFSNDLGRSGFMPLTALFDRPTIREVGRTQFEVGFALINDGLAAGMRANLTHSQGCGDPGNRLTFVPSDFGYRDHFFGTGSTALQSCQYLIDRPVEGELFSCADVEEDSPLFGGCVFQTADECRSGTLPTRPPSNGNSWCSVTGNTPGSGTCADCRAWYDITGQTHSGWQTQNELVDACVDDIGDDHSSCFGDCVNFCETAAQTFMATACQRYVGPTDEKWFGDPEDYECGELPIGQTHWTYGESTAEDDAEWGRPDFEWKLLQHLEVPNPRIGLIDGEPFDPIYVPVTIGRFGNQRPVSFSVGDLTSGGPRSETVGRALDPVQFWFALTPRSKEIAWDDEPTQLNVLETRVCAFVQGNTVDLGSISFNQNEAGLFSVVQDVRLGRVDVDQLDVCLTMDVVLDPDVSDVSADAVDVVNPRVISVDPENPRISEQEVSPGLLAIVPGYDVALQAVFSGAAAFEVFFGNTDSEIERRMLNFVLRRYSEEISDALGSRVQDTLARSLEEARANSRESLSDVCSDIAPNAPLGHPFQHFYRWVRWNCEDVAQANSIRPFLPTASSADAGCYTSSRFITPADAGRASWWRAYSGQEWYWAGFPDSGCRLAFEIQSNPDRALWRSLRCATHVFNAWLNNGAPTAGGRGVLVANTCGAYGEAAMEDLYAGNADLEELYSVLHPPNPAQPFGELEIE